VKRLGREAGDSTPVQKSGTIPPRPYDMVQKVDGHGWRQHVRAISIPYNDRVRGEEPPVDTARREHHVFQLPGTDHPFLDLHVAFSMNVRSDHVTALGTPTPTHSGRH
jgi:hypothetical protein